MKILNAEVISARVDPMLRFANSPSIYVDVSDKLNNENMIYHYTDGFYWCQTDTGYTDFCVHGGEIEWIGQDKDYDHYRTVKNNGGYGGSEFERKVADIDGCPLAIVHIMGPWSVGS